MPDASTRAPDPESGNEGAVPGYRDWAEIGRGGFGVVYRARDARFRRDVAIKILSGAVSGDARSRFLRECEAVGSLSGHPGIVSVYDMGFSDDGRTTFLVMEHLSGGTLAARAAGHGMPWQEAVECVVSLAGALESAHRAGVLHRDVKPENVLFTSFGAPKIVDFGIATVGGGYETRSAAITASLAHAAPEIVAGERATAASDTYSLASTLFFALTGAAPFSSDGDETLIPLIARIATQSLPDLRRAGVPDDVASAVERAMAKDPASRTQRPLELAQELVEAAGRSGVSLAEPVVVAAEPRQEANEEVAGGGETDVVGRRREPQPEATAEPTASRRRIGRAGLLTAVAMVALVCIGAAAASALGGSEQQAASTRTEQSGEPSDSSAETPSAAPSETGTETAAQDAEALPPASSANEPAAGAPAAGGPAAGAAAAPAAGTAGSPPSNGSTPSRGSESVAPSPQNQPNRPPTFSGVADRKSEELTSQTIALAASDPDGDPVSFSVSGLPAGLSATPSGVISGTIRHDAASVTGDRKSIKSKTFVVTVVVSDASASTTRQFTWTVTDTHRTMPNYVGKFGCNGDAGCAEAVPNVAVITTPTFTCTTSGAGARSTIVKQSVAPGAVIRWGQAVTYTYLEASCG